MTTPVNIEHLSELNKKRTQGEWKDISEEIGLPINAAFITELVNAFPYIIKELEAGRRLVEGLKRVDNPFKIIGGEHLRDVLDSFEEEANKHWRNQRDSLLKAYEDSTKN